MATGPIDLDKIVAKFVEIRDAKSELEKRHEQELLPYKQAMEQIEAFLMGRLNESGSESIRTSSGTFFKKLKESVTVASRESFYEWARNNNQTDLLDIRAAKTNILAYKVAHGDLPPGLNYRAEVEVQVRRA